MCLGVGVPYGSSLLQLGSDKFGIRPGFQVSLANLEIPRKAIDEFAIFVTKSLRVSGREENNVCTYCYGIWLCRGHLIPGDGIPFPIQLSSDALV